MKLEDLILGYENDFFRKEFCNNLDNLNNRIHDEFIEFGKSGQVFDKNYIVEYLNNLGFKRDIMIQDFQLKQPKDGVVIANYITSEKKEGGKTLRTSIWIKENSNWKLYFHQGTATKLNTSSVHNALNGCEL